MHTIRALILVAVFCVPALAQETVKKKSIDFSAEIQPILEQNCLSCHGTEQPEGGLDLSTAAKAREGGDGGPALIPFQPENSSLYTSASGDSDVIDLMPPEDAGGPLPEADLEKLRSWIKQGAAWPPELTLTAKEKGASSDSSSPDNLELIRKLREFIVEQSDKDASRMQDYSNVIPRTKAEYHMVALPGGDFMMGSPATETDRQDNEGPQARVTVKPFWIGKHEITWDEYEPFMSNGHDREKDGTRRDYDPGIHGMVDAVSCPTPPYMEMSFGMGQKGYPAISMTQHAANKYCQWLSAQTGHFYRLPTEAEWEYACRAGTTTAYSFGDDASRIDEFAWYYENSNEQYQKVGTKKANPWGLYDMHGNVMEWTADQYRDDFFRRLEPSPNPPFVEPTQLYPRTVRGGSWDDDPEQLRSAFRRGSQPAWKQQDPQLPKSLWYHTEALWLGFRIVRPKELPTVEEMDFFWNSGDQKKRP